ncbi:MAG: hypothetical protein ACR2FN_06005 [Chitinophagaceae bacterium]
MKAIKIFAVIAIAFSVNHLRAQTSITLNQVKTHVGDSITVCGKIYGAKYRYVAKESPSLLSMGDHFPNQPLTLVFDKEVRERFSYDPEKKLLNKTICVTGKIQNNNDEAEIIIESEAQIKVQD